MDKRTIAGLVTLSVLFLGMSGPVKALQVNDSGIKFSGDTEKIDGKTVCQREIDLITENVNYRIKLSLYEESGNLFITGIGLLGGIPGQVFSKRGWYYNSFMNVYLNEKNLFESPSEIQVIDNGVKFIFHTDKGEAVLTFTSESQSNRLLSDINLPEKDSTAKTVLLAFPGDYKKDKPEERDRWISTSQRELQYTEKKTVELTKDEPWIYYYDKLNNPEGNPALSTCAILYNPKEMEKVEVEVESYAIRTILYHLKGIPQFHFVFWEFPGEDYSKCLENMKKLTVSFE